MNSILVPLDGSQGAERALPIVGALGRTLGAPLILAHVLAPSDEAADDDARAASLRYLGQAAAHLGSFAIEVATTTLDDTPRDAIAHAAVERGASLIVMSTHGRGGLARALMGSLALGVVQATETPVLLVPPGVEGDHWLSGTGDVLVLLDGSAWSEESLPVALPIARALGWWWADPLAALAMVPIITKEGIGGVRGEACCDDCGCSTTNL